jgi:Carboxypeptidase regulatory-like domain
MGRSPNKQQVKLATRVQHRPLGTWVFGSLLLLFFLYIFIFAPPALPDYKQRMVALASALLAGLFAYFIIGDFGLDFRITKSAVGEIAIKSAGGIGIFVLVLLWWFSPLAPIPSDKGTKVHTEISEPGRTEESPASPEKPNALGNTSPSEPPTAKKQQAHNQSGSTKNQEGTLVSVTGLVIDDQSGQAIPGARVHIIGYVGSALTGQDGRFKLISHVPIDQFPVHVEKEGYKSQNLQYLVGSPGLTFQLSKK